MTSTRKEPVSRRDSGEMPYPGAHVAERGSALSKPVIAIEGLSKTYDGRGLDKLAIDGVDLSIDRGQFVSLIGPSGCGKSTLMMIVAGLLSYSGSVSIDGDRVDRPHPGLGVVFQSDVLLEWRSVLDNILVQAEVRGLDRATYRRRALSLLDRVGLSGYANAYPRELSGGMRQRVSICRALVHDASLLLMDEPFGALDAITREGMHELLTDILGSRQITVLFVTHDISEAVFLSDVVCVMARSPGRIHSAISVALPRPRVRSELDPVVVNRYETEVRQALSAASAAEKSMGTGETP